MKGKSRLQEYLDQQNQDGGNMTGANPGIDDEGFDSGDGNQRKVKKRLKTNIQSDLENTGDQTNKLMRIASSGGPSD